MTLEESREIIPLSRKPYQTKQSMADLEISPMIIEK